MIGWRINSNLLEIKFFKNYTQQRSTMNKSSEISQLTQNFVSVCVFKLRFEELNPQISLSERLIASFQITDRIENDG